LIDHYIPVLRANDLHISRHLEEAPGDRLKRNIKYWKSRMLGVWPREIKSRD